MFKYAPPVQFASPLRRQVSAAAMLGALMLFGTAVQAADSSDTTQKPPVNDSIHGPHIPPPEALQACNYKKSGDSCSFNGPRGTAEGTCWAPEDKVLACRPARPSKDSLPGAKGK